MKRVIAAGIVFCVIVVLSAFHTITICALADDIYEKSEKIMNACAAEEWQELRKELDALSERWEKCEFWASMTLRTNEIEDIDVSLAQSREYAKIENKENFIGEFIMFKMLVEHLPHQEGFSLTELL